MRAAIAASIWQFSTARMLIEYVEELYRLLEDEIVPRFFARDDEDLPVEWLGTMRAAIAASIWQFSTARMLIEYVEELYRPAVRSASGSAVPA